jgi:nucleotide-binding universal stress UspA family protein
VVVGIDRGSSSDAAALWAGEHAERLGVPLAPVHVRPVEDGLLRQGTTVGPVDRDAETALAADVARLVPELTGALEPRVLVGAVGARLVSACCPLDLLVLGSRHPGGRTHWVLGGAGAYAVTHAPCPVVLTR